MDHALGAIHVILAVFIIGPMALLPHTGLRALREHDGRRVTSVARSTGVFTWLSLLVFLFGFAAEGARGIPFTRLWIWLSVLLFLAAFVLSAFVVVPNLRHGAEEIERTPTAAGGEKLARPAAYSTVVSTAGIVTLLLVVVVILMAFRPGS